MASPGRDRVTEGQRPDPAIPAPCIWQSPRIQLGLIRASGDSLKDAGKIRCAHLPDVAG